VYGRDGSSITAVVSLAFGVSIVTNFQHLRDCIREDVCSEGVTISGVSCLTCLLAIFLTTSSFDIASNGWAFLTCLFIAAFAHLTYADQGPRIQQRETRQKAGRWASKLIRPCRPNRCRPNQRWADILNRLDSCYSAHFSPLCHFINLTKDSVRRVASISSAAYCHHHLEEPHYRDHLSCGSQAFAEG